MFWDGSASAENVTTKNARPLATAAGVACLDGSVNHSILGCSDLRVSFFFAPELEGGVFFVPRVCFLERSDAPS